MIYMLLSIFDYIFFFFNDTATTEIYTLSLHDALPICAGEVYRKSADQHHDLCARATFIPAFTCLIWTVAWSDRDRKSTRLNSSHSQISYAVFCLKKKKK